MNPIPQKYQIRAWLIAAIVFLVFGMRSLGLPGLYLDAVNPDYLAAFVLHPGIDNFRYLLPGNEHYPVLAGYYYGMQNFYVAVPFLAFLGTSVASVRMAQMVFGVIIIAASTKLVERVTRSTWMALAYGLMAATEVAFIASFRTQNFIILGGLAWTFVSLMLLFPKEEGAQARPGRMLASGVFAGLSSYGYFVLGFFYPAMLLLAWHQAESKTKGLRNWIIGICIGGLPYVIGYGKMWKAAGSFHAFVQQIRDNFAALHPIDQTGSFSINVGFAFDMVKLALSNDENSLMALGVATQSPYAMLKAHLFIALVVISLAWLLVDFIAKKRFAPDLMLALLPISYFCFAAFFGRRLWGHHFSVLIPFTFLLGIVLLNRVLKLLPIRDAGAPRILAVGLLAIAILIPNIRQQNHFFRELDRTGGVGKSSSALTFLADEALLQGHQAIYVFPEWGFFASFALITENKVPYIAEASKLSVDATRKVFPDRNELRLLYWDDKDEAHYREALQSSGASNITKRDYLQRDGRTAFHMLTGTLANLSAPAPTAP